MYKIGEYLSAFYRLNNRGVNGKNNEQINLADADIPKHKTSVCLLYSDHNFESCFVHLYILQ